jgi:hypothetical protein
VIYKVLYEFVLQKQRKAKRHVKIDTTFQAFCQMLKSKVGALGVIGESKIKFTGNLMLAITKTKIVFELEMAPKTSQYYVGPH